MRLQGRVGFTLVEVIVAASLVGAGLLLVVGLLPSGVLSLKKAEDLQTATAYGMEVMEISRGDLSHTPFLNDFQVMLNSTEFRVTREVMPVAGSDGRLFDVLVTVSWGDPPAQAQLATRMSPAAP